MYSTSSYFNTPHPYMRDLMRAEITNTNTYIVEGMSCGHCEAAVRYEAAA